jgi:hypothetical protein
MPHSSRYAFFQNYMREGAAPVARELRAALGVGFEQHYPHASMRTPNEPMFRDDAIDRQGLRHSYCAWLAATDWWRAKSAIFQQEKGKT